MNSFLKSCCTLGALALLPGVAGAAVFSTNFDSYAAGDVAGQDGWVINDTTADASAIIGIGGVWGARSATLGYVAPLIEDEVYLSHSVTTGLVGATFSTRFQVQDSDTIHGSGAETRDTFGFRLEDSSGNNLFSFFLNPFEQDALPENEIAFHTYSWSTGASTPTVALSPLAAQETFAYTLSVTFSQSGLNDVAFLADINGDQFAGVLTGLSAAQIGELGALWRPTLGASAPGSNFLIFDDISLIPEPSTTLLGLVGGLFLLRRRRA